MKITPEMVKQLADKLADVIANELSSTYRGCMIIHEDDMEVFIKLRDLIHRKNPIEGRSLHALREGIDILWDHSTLMSGQHMDLLARALDIAEQHDKNVKASEESELAKAY